MFKTNRFWIITVLFLFVGIMGSCGGGGGGGGDDGGGGTPINLTGNWSGSWTSFLGKGGAVNITFTQSGTELSGTVSVTGSDCFTAGTVSGTISATDVLIGIAFPGGQQVNYNGVVNTDGTSMNGNYVVSGGFCSGDYGSWSVNKF